MSTAGSYYYYKEFHLLCGRGHKSIDKLRWEYHLFPVFGFHWSYIIPSWFDW